jgi:hypothetical protein
MLRLFWINFKEVEISDVPVGCWMGIGVTAANETDALELARSHLFGNHVFPAVCEVKQISHLDELDQNHVVPNMGFHLKRGVWFPQATSS